MLDLKNKNRKKQKIIKRPQIFTEFIEKKKRLKSEGEEEERRKSGSTKETPRVFRLIYPNPKKIKKPRRKTRHLLERKRERERDAWV